MRDALEDFKQRLKHPEHRFADSLAFIEQHYQYQPQAFRNGALSNAADENQGSCKIFGLALLEGLSTEETLLAFAEHYRHVLASPAAQDHQNIRQLLKTGLDAVQFEQLPLSRR